MNEREAGGERKDLRKVEGPKTRPDFDHEWEVASARASSPSQRPVHHSVVGRV